MEENQPPPPPAPRQSSGRETGINLTDAVTHLRLQIEKSPWRAGNPGGPASLTNELGLQG